MVNAAFVTGQGQGSVFCRAFFIKDNGRSKTPFLYILHHQGKSVVKVQKFCFRQFRGAVIRINACQVAYFLSHNGTDACEMVVQGFLNGHGGGTHCLAEGFLCDRKRIFLGNGLGDEIGSPRQHLADRADLSGHMLDAVNDGAVLLAENDVAVLSHDFHNQFFAAQVPHLV